MIKQFKDVSENEVFRFNNLEYQKIQAVKISCCRSINAQETANANNKVFIQPTQEVEVNDQLQ